MKMNSSNQWLKIAGKILVALYVTLLLISCKNTVVADEIPASRQNQNAQPSKKIARDGQVLIRHAGDAWSRQMMREYLVNNKLNLDKTLTYKSAINDCQAIVPSMEKLKFKFIEPDIITDDWQDVRLDLYKKKYEKFKYGMGYTQAGPANRHIPSWNINVYNIDIDGNGVFETILYGERLLLGGRAESLGHTTLGSSYNIYEMNVKNNGLVIGAPLNGDPSDPRIKTNDYLLSALIKIHGTYAILAIYHWNVLFPEFSATVYLLGKHETTRPYDPNAKGPSKTIVKLPYRCRYQFNSSKIKND
jgi:hypothetical protein